MMPVDWPLAARAAAHPADPAPSRAGRSRLAVARADFFLDETCRLSEEERSLMTGMLKGLVADIVDELLSALPALVAARAEPSRDKVYSHLLDAGLLDRDGVMQLLLRRADVQRLSGPNLGTAGSLPSSMVGDDDAAVAEAAMALTIARGQRLDRFGRYGVTFDDLPAEDAVALVYAVAAALRHSLDHDADVPLADAARDLLARHDEGRRADAVVQALVRALDAVGRVNDEMVQRTAEAMDAGLLVGLLARRGGIGYDDAWAMFVGGDAPMLVRIAQCDRPTAARIFAAFDQRLGRDGADRMIEAFDSLSEVQVDRYRGWLRLDPQYRDALDRMGGADG